MNTLPLQTERPPIPCGDRTAKTQTFPAFWGFLPYDARNGNSLAWSPRHATV